MLFRSHGYIAGESFTCPECGEEAEVYSRITGYYRPVQNWNDGKAQEYKDRTVYAESKLTGKKPLYANEECGMQSEDEVQSEGEVQSAECRVQSDAPDKLLLFTTKTCPKCRMAKMFLDQAGIGYETLLAEENAELSKAYGIKEAPTLVVIKGDTAELISNPSNIKGFVDRNCVKA